MASSAITSRLLGYGLKTRNAVHTRLTASHVTASGMPASNRNSWHLRHKASRKPESGGHHSLYLRYRLASSLASHPRGSYTTCASAVGEKHKLVFLGTPDIAANVLQALIEEANKPESSFEIAAVVTQPGRPTGRKRIVKPSPVEVLAREAGMPDESILTPVSAKDEEFLERMKAIGPCLCVTAAYGNFLPQKFLDIPEFGTLNIHPSLLPEFRGAAPVQRALESGVSKSGVTVAFTVLKMDAGPVLAQDLVDVDPNIKAPEFLEQMFDKGARLLIDRLDSVWSGEAAENATPQDEDAVIHTEKLTKEEALLDFSLPAQTLHDKVRGFAGWPGTESHFTTSDPDGNTESIRLKIITTKVGMEGPADPMEVEFRGNAMIVQCAEDSVLEVLEVQPPGKKVMAAKAFQNGLKNGNKRLFKSVASPED